MTEDYVAKKIFKIVASGDLVTMANIFEKSGSELNLLEMRDHKGRLLVHVAAKKGRVKCLFELFKQGSTVDEYVIVYTHIIILHNGH